MFRSLLVILFLLRIKLSRSAHTADYLRRKYDGYTLRLYRRLESSTKKWKKAQLDQDFLMYCKMNNIMPNFVKFKLYRASLYSSEFYKSSCLSLLNIELNLKSKAITRLKSSVTSLSNTLYSALSLLDGLYIKYVLRDNITKYASDVQKTHDRKLQKLGIHQPQFLSPNNVLFNYSDYNLSKKEKFLLSLGLVFCLPNFKPNFCKFFLSFELFYNIIRSPPAHINLESARQSIQSVAHKAYASYKATNWFPFFKKEDFHILKKLSKNKDIVLCKPDKGKGVVLLNRDDYIKK